MKFFDFIKLAKTAGSICVLLAIVMSINTIVAELTGLPIGSGLIGLSIQYLLYGIIIYGMGMIIDYLEKHYMEMKYFRKHYIEKDDELNKRN